MIDQNAVGAAAPAAPEVDGLVEAARQLVDCGCLDGRLSVVDQIASALSAQAAEIERLQADLADWKSACMENAEAWGDEKARAERAEAATAAANARLEKADMVIEPESCEYCSDGRRTGLPGNACENCFGTGLKYPEHSK